jgi:predicted phage terminase large subunit-like protein
MRHLKLDKDRFAWQGSELVYVAFDELTHFLESQFWYLFSRMRSATSGISPYMRCTTNPVSPDDPDGGWVARLIDWWLDDDGFPIAERSGQIRYLERRDGELIWFDEPTEFSKSFTFIPSTVYDNQALLTRDPDYLRNLMSLPLVQRRRLLEGNWKIKESSGTMFRSDWFEVFSEIPVEFQGRGTWLRFWDFAATASDFTAKGKGPDWTVGIQVVYLDGVAIVTDVVRDRLSPEQVNRRFQQTATRDGVGCIQGWWQDPGQAGIQQSYQLQSLLPGLATKALQSQQNKWTRSLAVSSAVERGRVKVLDAAWRPTLMNELEQFPDGDFDDQVDAIAGAWSLAVEPNQGWGVGQFLG